MSELNVGRIVNVDLSLSPSAIARPGFGSLLIATDETPTSSFTGLKPYASIEELNADFASTTNTGKAAALYFSQSPKPNKVYVGCLDGSETPATFVARAAGISNDWYAIIFACSTSATVADANLIAAAGVVESLTAPHVLGITTSDSDSLDAYSTDDIGYKLKQLGYKRTVVQYSQNPHAVASLLGRALTTKFDESASTITLMFKQEPSVVAESLTTSSADSLQQKNINCFVKYSNDTAIIQYGVMSSGDYFDEVHGLDWFVNAVQTELYNVLYTSSTKIPQTDAGQNQLLTACQLVCDDAVNNGLIAPGVWHADGFGQLKRGDYLDSGYYIYSAPFSTQSAGDRAARKSMPIRIAVKLAGAVHTIDCTINVNR